MKYGKKTMAIICAAACAATSFAITACGRDDKDSKEPTIKGEQVTEAQWKEYIDNTLNLQSASFSCISDAGVNYESTMNEPPIKVYVELSGSVDIENKAAYARGKETQTAKNQTTVKDIESIVFIEDDEVWRASYYNKEIEYVDNRQLDYDGEVITYDKQIKKELLFWCSSFDKEYYVSESYEECATIRNLYSAFTYNKTTQAYTAKLYIKYYSDCEISLVFKDNYVLEIVFKTSYHKENSYENRQFNFYDYNKATATIPIEQIDQIKNYNAQK